MAWKRAYGHKDRNHSEIVEGLRKSGVYVIELHGQGNGCADLLCYSGANGTLIEVKNEKDARFSRSQIELLAYCPGNVGFARDYEEAYRLAKFPQGYGLSQSEKAELRRLLATDDFERIGLKKFLEVIGRV